VIELQTSHEAVASGHYVALEWCAVADEGKGGAVATRVYFEEGKSSVFAAAIDWPGWCRRAKSRDAALEALLDYQGRYAAFSLCLSSPHIRSRRRGSR